MMIGVLRVVIKNPSTFVVASEISNINTTSSEIKNYFSFSEALKILSKR